LTTGDQEFIDVNLRASDFSEHSSVNLVRLKEQGDEMLQVTK